MLTHSALVALLGATSSVSAQVYTVPSQPNPKGEPLDGFVSYSIEFSSFPEFAGNKSSPNLFSYNLINNLGALSGSKPYIRVGGNTQDYALYNASQETSLVGIVNPSRSPDYPTTIHIGPSYFESYGTWPGVKFSHGFNLGLGGNRSEGWQTLSDTVPLACKALSHGNLYTWEYGNEPDLFSTSAQGPVRPSSWNESTYVWQWLNGTAEIKKQIVKHCPALALFGEPTFMAPSFAGTGNHLKAIPAFQDGLDKNKNIEYFSTHNYISGATSPGVTLQGTLMNHTRTVGSVEGHLPEGTKAPYYGSIAVAATLGNSALLPVSITNLPLPDAREAAYAAHYSSGLLRGHLARITVLNMRGYNTTVDGQGLEPVPSPPPRPSQKYTFAVSGVRNGARVGVQRLLANGSDAITGITFDGWSYNYELDKGKPVRLHNVTVGETAVVRNGQVTVDVPDSSAVLLSFPLL
ncbi:glycoside hydrolase family 79 [Trichoderma reesei QM6a]|uniref:Glycoside hydrolase family 79 n=1 Tax=Hypocrea jecorina (strain QM6a) TaxID=431241 RepID=G0RGT2_HYPJQ|nr:glycoside hydrolase family 79 [Trichoderma reesei QM6a]EGR49630.1 glycoside hydrolase family 79 [Trichoderma reesei QM6a]